jgi:hypothetical protein
MSTNTLKLSVIVIVYKMSRQAMNTLFSLSTACQLEVEPADYEVIVIENSSSDTLIADRVLALGPNFRYFLRQESRPTPVYAINFGVEQAHAAHICLMIDGARLVTPRLIRYTLDLIRLCNTGVIATPGYHLGEQDHRFNISANHNEQAERALLEKIGWPQNGYKLFEIACFSASNVHGYLHPMMESNCLTFNKRAFIDIGGANEGFQTPGGGSVNLDIYRQLVLRQESWLFILPGEGSFHQFHGGITTSESAELDKVLATHRDELIKIRNKPYEAAKREPTLYGAISGPALRFLHLSSQAAQHRFTRFANSGQNPWPDD